MKQTATDYLYEQVLDLFIQYTEDKINSVRFAVLMERAKAKAKEMEKGQITEARTTSPITSGDVELDKQEAQQYYNETYGKDSNASTN